MQQRAQKAKKRKICFTLSLVLMLAGAANEKTALKMILWSVLILIAGVNVLMNITQKLGGIDLLASILATFMSSRTAAPIMGVTEESCPGSPVQMSWYSRP